MSQAPIMPFFTDAYLADTHHLSTEAHGAYLLLLLYSWRCNGAPPPDDDRMLSRITKLSLRRWRSTMRAQLEPFYSIENGLWHQKRLQETWDDVQRKIDLQRQKGVKGNWMRKKQAKALSADTSPSAAASAQASPTHKPITINHKPPATPALDALKPILSDVHYFVRGGKQLSPALAPQIKEAQHEAASLIAPMGRDDAAHQVERLWRMYPSKGSDSEALKHDYIDWFARYPADLSAQTCDLLLTQHAYASPPRLADIAQHITPLHEQRKATLQRINRLAAQVGLDALTH